MSALGKLTSAIIQTVLIPVSVVADVVTLGGVLTDEDSSYTTRSASGIRKTIGKALDELEAGK